MVRDNMRRPERAAVMCSYVGTCDCPSPGAGIASIQQPTSGVPGDATLWVAGMVLAYRGAGAPPLGVIRLQMARFVAPKFDRGP